jgi:hypothetical protein
MKLSDPLPRLSVSLPNKELLETGADNTVWLITCYSTALGLALVAALLNARQGAVLVRGNHGKPQ